MTEKKNLHLKHGIQKFRFPASGFTIVVIFVMRLILRLPPLKQFVDLYSKGWKKAMSLRPELAVFVLDCIPQSERCDCSGQPNGGITPALHMLLLPKSAK